jgi:hypothetical protein
VADTMETTPTGCTVPLKVEEGGPDWAECK